MDRIGWLTGLTGFVFTGLGFFAGGSRREIPNCFKGRSFFVKMQAEDRRLKIED